MPSVEGSYLLLACHFLFRAAQERFWMDTSAFTRVLAALAEDSISIPSIHIGQYTVAYHSGSG